VFFANLPLLVLWGNSLTLGNAIKLIRTARGIKQRDLASQLDVSANYLSLIEGGKREPSLAFLNRLAEKLCIPIAMLFVFQGEPIPGVQSSDIDKLRDLLLTLDRMVVGKSGT
jgi:transcriptional regulator with XRE-family HTH domain